MDSRPDPACVLCGGHDFRPLLRGADMEASRFFRCRACTLLQMRPMPTDRELFDYYQRYDIVGEHYPYFAALWRPDALDTPEGREIRERAGLVLAATPRPQRVLEVGSGHGLFLKVLVDAGVHAEGVELSARAAERSRAAHGVTVHAGTLDSVPGSTFDAIAMWDLLEHVADPHGLVAQAAARLSPGGRLFVETPDEAALLDRTILALHRLGVSWPARQFYGTHHLVLFRRASIRRLLEQHGFVVEGITGASTYVARSFSGSGLKARASRLFLGALFALAKLVGRQNKMIVVAKKR